MIILYLVGMLWGEVGMLDAKEISSRSCIVLANLRWSYDLIIEAKISKMLTACDPQ